MLLYYTIKLLIIQNKKNLSFMLDYKLVGFILRIETTIEEDLSREYLVKELFKAALVLVESNILNVVLVLNFIK